MHQIDMQDISPGGHQLSAATVTDLPASASLRAVIAARIRAEVAAYNAELGETYVGMVQPEDAIRYSSGFRMRTPRPLDADHFLTAVEEAVAAGVVSFRIDDASVTDLDTPVAVDSQDSITTIMQRPIVARVP